MVLGDRWDMAVYKEGFKKELLTAGTSGVEVTGSLELVFGKIVMSFGNMSNF